MLVHSYDILKLELLKLVFAYRCDSHFSWFFVCVSISGLFFSHVNIVFYVLPWLLLQAGATESQNNFNPEIRCVSTLQHDSSNLC